MPLFLTQTQGTVADTVANVKPDLAQKFTQLSTLSSEEIVDMGLNFVIETGSKIAIALIIFLLGRYLIGLVTKFLKKMMSKRNVDVSLTGFITTLTRVVLLLLLITVAIGILGLNTSSFVALFASAGLAFGMALSGTLQNFAGGVMILVLKPFKIGDVVEMQGYTGTVKEIMLFNTLVNTFDNKAILIPNGSISTGIVNNFSREETRRVDWLFSISYGDDFDLAVSVLEELIAKDARIMKDPVFTIAMDSMGDSSVNIVVRVWVKQENYWGVYFDMNKNVYKTFPERGLNFPYPHMDVTLTK